MKVSSYRLAALGVVLGADAQVVAVTENSPALFAGMAQGDHILAVNGQTMDLAALEALEIDAAVMVLVEAPMAARGMSSWTPGAARTACGRWAVRMCLTPTWWCSDLRAKGTVPCKTAS